MKTTENNKIIAEFMKWDILNDMTYSKATKGKWIELDKLKFHSDWNWLMEVIEKIEKLKTPITNNPNLEGQFEDYEIHIQGKLVIIYAHGEVTKDVCYIKGESKIKAVYNACLEFIKWYNNQNK